MRREDYTDDVICAAMGVGAFEPAAPHAIRLLLKPSFHAEACVTVEPAGLHVVALRSMLWHEPVPGRMPELSETIALSDGQFEAITAAFDRAVAEATADAGGMAWLDGMPVSAVRLDAGGRSAFAGQPAGPVRVAFVADLLRLAYASASSEPLRNRIAECARYVDVRLKIEPDPDPDPDPEPDGPAVTRVMVLGAAGDRAEYLEQSQRRAAGRPPK